MQLALRSVVAVVAIALPLGCGPSREEVAREAERASELAHLKFVLGMLREFKAGGIETSGTSTEDLLRNSEIQSLARRDPTLERDFKTHLPDDRLDESLSTSTAKYILVVETKYEVDGRSLGSRAVLDVDPSKLAELQESMPRNRFQAIRVTYLRDEPEEHWRNGIDGIEEEIRETKSKIKTLER